MWECCYPKFHIHALDSCITGPGFMNSMDDFLCVPGVLCEIMKMRCRNRVRSAVVMVINHSGTSGAWRPRQEPSNHRSCRGSIELLFVQDNCQSLAAGGGFFFQAMSGLPSRVMTRHAAITSRAPMLEPASGISFHIHQPIRPAASTVI